MEEVANIDSLLTLMPKNKNNLSEKQYARIRESLSKIKQKLDVPEPPDNFDMPVNKIKEILVKECIPGNSFYPSDIAFKHGLDYQATLDAVEILRKEGKLEEAPSRIMAAKTHNAIIKEIRSEDLNEIADGVERLYKMTTDDSTKPAINLESLRLMSRFLSENRPPTPHISTYSNGIMQAKWRLENNGYVILSFLSTGLVQFGGNYYPAQDSLDLNWEVRGCIPVEYAGSMLSPFLRKCASEKTRDDSA